MPGWKSGGTRNEAPAQQENESGPLAGHRHICDQLVVECGRVALIFNSDRARSGIARETAAQALNGLIACGVPQDWTTHMIGHELTAFYGLDDAQTLAVVMPAVWRHQKNAKGAKLAQYGSRVLGLAVSQDTADQAIRKTEEFFRGLGMKTRLSEYGIGAERFEEIGARFEQRGLKLGGHGAIGRKEVVEVLNLCR